MSFSSAEDVLAMEEVSEALRRGIISISNRRITYRLNQQKSYDWQDPEEWIRAYTIAWLIISKDYPANRIKTEVSVPRRTPNDFADIVVFRDDQCREPYLVVENKSSNQTQTKRSQGIEQLFGNANSLRSALGLYDEGVQSVLFNISDFPPIERNENRLGDRFRLPRQYGEIPEYSFIAGQEGDISPVASSIISSKIRNAHYIIWAGGRRDPLLAFDEWSKLLFAKVIDERTTPTGQPRRFQYGKRETSAAVANRVHRLFDEAIRSDPAVFSSDSKINLPDSKIAEVVRSLQDISFIRTDIDSIGQAFELFFGSVFRGELGQYFTMRQLARFTVAVLDIDHNDYVLDPTAGSGGFLLETLLQTWHRVDREFLGQPNAITERLKTDFALAHVYGIEIHEILARICKINLLLHHDGHTNIEADRSCLDATFTNPRLNIPNGSFSKIVGNPPFGDEVNENDEDHLGSNHLSNFEIAYGKLKVNSEQVILEQCIRFLEPGGKMGLIIPDGLLNNQGQQSNCPQTRCLLAKHGKIEAIVSLPDHAFRKSGAQNKTSILFFKKYTSQEQRYIEQAYNTILEEIHGPEFVPPTNSFNVTYPEFASIISSAISRANLDYNVFLAEANHVGYTTTGAFDHRNNLFSQENDGSISIDQSGTILGEWRRFTEDEFNYTGRTSPDCMSINFTALWKAHISHRLDPKYHLFQREADRIAPSGWIKNKIGNLMRRRTTPVDNFENDRTYLVLTISQTGELRPRQAGIGNNPSEWTGDYFSLISPGDWFAAQTNDVVFSSIDLWKGCIAVVPSEFSGGLVTKEFPIYEIVDHRLTADFLQCLLRSRYYQRAFRSITTGHSNRRRTQIQDFESLEIAFPPEPAEQLNLISGIRSARHTQKEAAESLKAELTSFSSIIDERGLEELPDIEQEYDSE